MRNTILSIFLSTVQLFSLEKPPYVTYIHPPPDAQVISPQTTLLLKVTPEMQHQLEPSLFTFVVNGAISGHHSGTVLISDNTLIFKPASQFLPGEKVTISIKSTLADWQEPFEYSFTTNDLVIPLDKNLSSLNIDEQRVDIHSTVKTYGDVTVLNGVSVPSDFPVIKVDILKNGISPGRIFINNWLGVQYIMILENDGTPYFYRRVEGDGRDFKVQPNGMLTRRFRGDLECFVGMDSKYAVVDTFRCTHGYGTDEHEIVMTPNGHYFLIALGYHQVDMSKLIAGGKANATVVDNHIQEFDRNHNLVFEWLCFADFNVLDAVHEDLTKDFIDYMHLNSIDIDYDGHIIISNRHPSEITKINRQTGKIIWRFGGKKNMFQLKNDPFGISYQHYARVVPDKPNHYTVFDNGNFHQPPFSRAVEYYLDTTNMTATKVWEYRHKPDRYTGWMGNAQRLPNGNTFIDWADGSLPKATEVTPSGDVVYEADFVQYSHCYRTQRYQWESAADRPYLLAESFPDKVTLIFNKFGDKTVKNYIIYGSKSKRFQTPLDTTTQTYFHYRDLDNNTLYYFRVNAVDSAGKQSVSSDVVEVMVRYLQPGENFLRNGNFSQGLTNWNLAVYDVAKASGNLNSKGEYYLNIDNGGNELWSVQLTQDNVPLIHGRRYLFEFDSYADADRAVDAKLERNGQPYENYGKISLSLLKRQKQHKAFEFVMDDPTDYSARVVFNCGKSNFDLYLDNVSVKEIVTASINDEEQKTPQTFCLADNYPNPFNARTKIRYAVTELCRVQINIYNVRGEQVQKLINLPHEPGIDEIEFDASQVSSGIYFYEFIAQAVFSQNYFHQVKKMTVVK